MTRDEDTVDIISKLQQELSLVYQSPLESGPAARWSGVRGSLRSLVLALALGPQINTKGSTWLCLLSDDDSVWEAKEDVEALLRLFPSSDTLPLVLAFPGWDSDPYLSASPSIRVRHARVSTLAQICESPKTPKLILATAEGALRCTMPASEFSSRSILLETGRSGYNREALSLDLQSLGFLRADSVEDPGTYAFRGEILDVFPLHHEQPVRIEFFDDLIERMRPFDPKTQRTLSPEVGANLATLRVYPAREVILDPISTPRLRERIKQFADDRNISRSIRDPIMASIVPGLNPEHADSWLSFCWDNPSYIYDFLPSHFRLMVADSQELTLKYASLLASYAKSEANLAQRSLIVPPLQSLFLSPEAFNSFCQSRTSLHLSSLPEGPAEVRGSLSRVFDSVDSSLFFKRTESLERGGAAHWVRDLLENSYHVFVLIENSSQVERIEKLFNDQDILIRRLSSGFLTPREARLPLGFVYLIEGRLSAGAVLRSEKLAWIKGSELLGSALVRSQFKKSRRAAAAEKRSTSIQEWSELQSLSDLQLGDPVVHQDHGVGRYRGITRLSLGPASSDFLLIEYDGADKLYVPVWRLNIIQKYSGSSESAPLDRLGSQTFAKQKEQARESARTLAFDLVRLYAEREMKAASAFTIPIESFETFEDSFPYEETPDQLRAVEAVIEDLQKGRPMDRLICGDVGYGKTEVAIRAAFLAVSQGKQVAVLVPTTLLASQHEATFRSRLEAHAIRVESITRFRSKAEQKKVLEQVHSGQVDVLIGTHRVLSRDVHFKDLGLIVIDEEQRFGVEHKELLKTLKVNTHVLTLTATPIPRTLHLALSGLRDISLINTPPVDRLPIKTWVSRKDDELIANAIRQELARGGQAFFLHNRVQTIQETCSHLKALVPEARYCVAHGQMSERELDAAMRSFLGKESDVLVCTAIIESGLDIPSANTIIVDRADQFGLSQLYQIRGRVGRGQLRAFAYLMTPAEAPITEDARKRLDVIQRFIELGSGFSVASHDLEIRGGGDLLGPEQSGHIAAVGYDLYMELLEEEIRSIRAEGRPIDDASSKARDPEIKMPFSAFLSEGFVPELKSRLNLYKRLSTAKTEAELSAIEQELQDRFGRLPQESVNLIWLIRIKILLKQYHVEVLTVGDKKIALSAGSNHRFNLDRIVALIASSPDEYQLTPDSRFIAKADTSNIQQTFFSLEGFLKRLSIP
jgi:transcription-repair coupling factor (superfamily II helicase)